MTLHDHCRSRHLLWLFGACLTLAAGVALAEKPKTNAVTQPSELMTFENVRIVNTPAAVKSKSGVKPAAPGMRAYLGADGQLASPTVDQIRELETNSTPKSATSLSKKSAVAKSSVVDQVTQVTTGAGNIYAVGDEFTVYQVAHKEGTAIVMQETTGKSTAEKAVKAKPADRATSKKDAEVANER